MTASSPVARSRGKRGAKGVMGKGEKAKRLANPVSKMADALMADFPEFPRSVHEAVRMKKIICPEQNCCENMIFFEESGLGQHYRTIYKKDANAKVITKARSKTQDIYGGETLQFISAISEWKSKEGI